MRKFVCINTYEEEDKVFILGNVYEMNEMGSLTGEDGFEWRRGSEKNGVKWLHKNTQYRFKEIFNKKNIGDEHPKITIKVEGRKTIAKMWKNGKLVKERFCVCHEDDEFDYAKGVEIATKRLFNWDYGREEKKKKTKTVEKIYSKYNKCLGEVGAPTSLATANGTRLLVGDVVKVWNPKTDYISEMVVCFLEDKEALYGQAIFLEENGAMDGKIIVLYNESNKADTMNKYGLKICKEVKE